MHVIVIHTCRIDKERIAAPELTCLFIHFVNEGSDRAGDFICQHMGSIVTVINDSKKEYEDFFTKLSDSAKRDQSYLRQVLKGQRNFSIGVLQDIGSAFGMRYIMLPVPESPQLKRLIRRLRP